VRTPQPWTRQQLAAYVSAYQVVYEQRIRRLLKALFVPTGILFAVLAGVLLLKDRQSQTAFSAVVVLAVGFLVYILGLALYIVTTSGRFEREHAVRCDACRQVLPVLAPSPGFSWLKPRFLRIDEAITRSVDLRCPRCSARISGAEQ
jgi:hypothetical protein